MQVRYLILPASNKNLLSLFNITPPEGIKKNVNESCRICLCGQGNLTNLYDDKRYFESMSISDAIVDCFGVKISPDVTLSSFICSECIVKTQNAYTFRHTMLKGGKTISIHTCYLESSDELEVKPFLPMLTEDLNMFSSVTKVNEDEVNCDVAPTLEIPSPKEEPTVNLKLSSALDLMTDISNKPLLSTLKKSLEETSNKNRISSKQSNSTSLPTDRSTSRLKMNVKPARTCLRKIKPKIVFSPSENEHNYSKSSIKVVTKNTTALESAPTTSSMKTNEEPLAEPNEKKDVIRPLADFKEKWWSQACGPPYQCKLCEQNFGTPYSLFYAHVRRHLRMKHPCTVCGKRLFSNKMSLHMRSHTNERPYLCEQCPARFTTFANLKRHLIGHTGKKPYTCKVCGKGFTQNSSLQRHLGIHYRSQTFVCEICGIILSYSSYKFHKSKYHRESNTATESIETFPCDQCDTVFSKSQSLARHYKIHNIVSYTCKICDATFEESYSYDIHMFIHEMQSYDTDDGNEKPLHCKFCLDIYDTKNDMEQHLLTHFNNPYKCKNCDKSFATKLRWRAHVQKYCEPRPYSCAHCGKSFRTFGTLYQHKKCHSGVKKHIYMSSM